MRLRGSDLPLWVGSNTLLQLKGPSSAASRRVSSRTEGGGEESGKGRTSTAKAPRRRARATSVSRRSPTKATRAKSCGFPCCSMNHCRTSAALKGFLRDVLMRRNDPLFSTRVLAEPKSSSNSRMELESTKSRESKMFTAEIIVLSETEACRACLPRVQSVSSLSKIIVSTPSAESSLKLISETLRSHKCGRRNRGVVVNILLQSCFFGRKFFSAFNPPR